MTKSRILTQPKVFNKKDWKNSKAYGKKNIKFGSNNILGARKEQIYADYERRLVEAFAFNSTEVVPIIPVLHGTSLPVALSIASTGFVALSSLVF